MRTEEEYEELIVQIQEELEKFLALRSKLEENSKKTIEELSYIGTELKTKISDFQLGLSLKKQRAEVLELFDKKVGDLISSYATRSELSRIKDTNRELERVLQHLQGKLSDIENKSIELNDLAKRFETFKLIVILAMSFSLASLLVSMLVIINL